MKKNASIEINKSRIDLIIHYKSTKYIKFRYKNNILNVICPYFTSLSSIKKYIENNKKILSYCDIESPLTSSYCYIYGKKELIFNNYLKIEDEIISYNEDKFYKLIENIFYNYVYSRLNYYKELMNINTDYKLKIKRLTSKYGSNNKVKKIITINSYLMHFNKDIIDSVIIHELAHDIYFNHSKDFHQLLLKYCPNYKILNNYLNFHQYGGMLND